MKEELLNIELTQQEKTALVNFLRENVDGLSNMSTLAYVPPAAQLRQQADRIERREREAPLLKEILRRLTHPT